MKRKTAATGKRYRRWIACVLAGVLFVQGYHASAAEPDGSLESISENALKEQDAVETQNTVEEPEIQEAEENDVWLEETVSQNSISENSISENSAESAMTGADGEPAENGETPGNMDEAESVSENTTEESVSENTAEESVSENTTEESVSENTTEGSISENTTEGSISENTAEESVSENTTEESVSGNTTGESASTDIMSADRMAAAAGGRAAVPLTAPVIKSVVPKDISAEIRFTHQLEETRQIQYEVLVRDEVKGVDLAIQPGTGDGIVTIDGYDGKAVNVFRIAGLSANKKYSVILRAKYGETGEPVSSAKKVFTTKRDMIATDGSMKVRYADMEQLKNDQTKTPEDVPAAGVQMKPGESCALYAQVSRLMRAVETDKLKWAVTPTADAPKNGLKVKASKSTYEAVLTAESTGSYLVTATNTLSGETVSTFQVTVK